jgi:hypothetical protein
LILIEVSEELLKLEPEFLPRVLHFVKDSHDLNAGIEIDLGPYVFILRVKDVAGHFVQEFLYIGRLKAAGYL